MANTITCSLAVSSYTPPAVHAGTNSIRGRYVLPTGFSLSSAAAMLLVSKIPVNAKDVQIHSYTAQAGTGPVAVINFGVRNGTSASTSISALGNAPALGHYLGPPYTPSWDDAGGEQFKYVTATLESGTASASISLNFCISYHF